MRFALAALTVAMLCGCGEQPSAADAAVDAGVASGPDAASPPDAGRDSVTVTLRWSYWILSPGRTCDTCGVGCYCPPGDACEDRPCSGGQCIKSCAQTVTCGTAKQILRSDLNRAVGDYGTCPLSEEAVGFYAIDCGAIGWELDSAKIPYTTTTDCSWSLPYAL